MTLALRRRRFVFLFPSLLSAFHFGSPLRKPSSGVRMMRVSEGSRQGCCSSLRSLLRHLVLHRESLHRSHMVDEDLT